MNGYDQEVVAVNAKTTREITALLHAVLTLADNLGLQVVAEGVENAEQLALLQALGCEYVQGYYFSKPLPPIEIESFACLELKLPLSEIESLAASVPVSTLGDTFSKTPLC